jgi:hypothetical protein
VPGAEVTISIWSSEDDLVSVSESEVVSTGIIGTTTSSSTGSYSAAATQTSQFPAISGIYDATVFVAGEGGAFAVHETSLRYDAGTLTCSPISELQSVTQLETETVIEPAPGKDEGTDPVDPTGTGASAMFATEGGTAGEFPGTSEVVSETGSTQGVNFTLDAQYVSDGGQEGSTGLRCGTTLTKRYPGIHVYVGSLHSTTNYGFTNDFDYGAGGTATLQTAVGVAGVIDPGQSTTRTVSSSTGWSATSRAGHQVLGTYFTYGKYSTRQCSINGDRYYSTYKAEGHEGGATRLTAAKPIASYCRPHAAGTKFTKEATKAVTWNRGVKFSKIIGFDLHSSSGYTTTARQTFTFSSAKRLCGVKALPAYAAGQLVVKAP